MFKKVGLGARIIGSFMLVVALTIVLGVVSYSSANKMNMESKNLLSSYFPLINAILGIQVDLGESVFGIHEYVIEMSKDPKGGYPQVSEKSKSNNFKDPVSRYNEGLEEMIEGIDKKNGALYVAPEVEEGFKKTRDAVIELDRYAKQVFSTTGGKNISEVEEKNSVEIYKLYDKIDDFLDDSQEKIEKQIDISVEASKNAHATAVATIIIMSIVSAVVGLLTGILLTRSIVGPTNAVISTLKLGSDQITSASEQLNGSSQELAQGASEQAASLEETSSSIEEMSSMIQRNTENTRQARDMSNEAYKVATSGVESMSRLSKSISEIQASSVETAKIIKTIDEIAFQTNLLTLNAAVEAGKGFAVVAEEVRNLAKRSADAARNTSDLIMSSQKNVDNGVAVTDEVRKTLAEIGENVTKVKNLVNDVYSSSEEQAQAIGQISQAVNQMNTVTQRTSANAEETASSSEELFSQAEELRGSVVKLMEIVGKPESDEIKDLYGNRNASKNKTAAAGRPVKKDYIDPKTIIPLSSSEEDELKAF